MIDDDSNYYYRFPDDLSDRLDFVYYHPDLDEIKEFREMNKLNRFGSVVIDDGVDYGINESGLEDGAVSFVNIQNLGDTGTIDGANLAYVKEAPVDKLLKENDILISRSRLVGKSAKVTREFEGATFGSYILRFKLKERMDYGIDFLVRYLNCNHGQKQVRMLQTGSSGKNINPNQLMDIALPQVSMERQEDMIGHVTEIEKEAGSYEKESNDMLLNAEKELLTSVGVDLPEIEDVFSYYATHAPENPTARLDFEFNNPAYDRIDELLSKKEITSLRLSDAVDFLMDSADPRLQPDESFNYVDITNINTRWGMPTPMEMKGSDATSSRMRRVMREDTILVSTTRPTRNAIALVPDELDGQICSTGLAVLRCKAGIDMRYLFHMLRTRLMRMQLKRNCSGSGYPAINQEIDLPNIRIPFPSDTNQQSAIAGRIDEILDRAKSIEDRAKKHRQRAREAFESRILEEVGFTVPS